MLDAFPRTASAFAGPTSDFLKNEILRVGAPAHEVRSALAFVGNEVSFDPRAYEALSPRMRRLVDLVGVAGSSLFESICETHGS